MILYPGFLLSLPRAQVLVILTELRFILTQGYVLLILESDGERERKKKNTDVRDKHRSVASSTHPDRGLNPQPRHMPWPGITPATFWCTGQHCNKLGHPVRATDSTFILSWYTVIQYVKNITVYLVTPMSFFLHLFISTNSFTQMNFLPSWVISSGYI